MQYVPTYREVNLADAIIKGTFGVSIEELLKSRKQVALQQKRAAIQQKKAEQAEAEKQKAEADLLKVEADRIKTIFKLNEELHLPVDKIAQLLGLEPSFVVSILEKKQETPDA